jgi:hypothetical protein
MNKGIEDIQIRRKWNTVVVAVSRNDYVCVSGNLTSSFKKNTDLDRAVCAVVCVTGWKIFTQTAWRRADRYRGQSSRCVKLTIHLHPAPRLKMSGARPLLLTYASVTWAGNTILPSSMTNHTKVSKHCPHYRALSTKNSDQTHTPVQLS